MANGIGPTFDPYSIWYQPDLWAAIFAIVQRVNRYELDVEDEIESVLDDIYSPLEVLRRYRYVPETLTGADHLVAEIRRFQAEEVEAVDTEGGGDG